MEKIEDLGKEVKDSEMISKSKGAVESVPMKATRESYGEELVELGKQNEDVVVLDADLAEATKTILFKKAFPDRFFDIGIAEQDMMGTAAGLGLSGKIPFASSFAIFAAGRAYEQVRNAIAYPNLNVKIVATHAGITVGEDGASHQSIEDLALMRGLPNMTVLSPCDDRETRWILKEALKKKGPVYIRLSRPKVLEVYKDAEKFEWGKAIVHGDGKEAAILATGVAVQEALKAKEQLEKENIFIRVLDIHTIKPIDKLAIVKAAKETKKLITVEDHSVIGGLGSAVCEVLAEEYPTKVIRLGIQDTFGESGKCEELMEKYGINSEAIIKAVKM